MRTNKIQLSAVTILIAIIVLLLTLLFAIFTNPKEAHADDGLTTTFNVIQYVTGNADGSNSSMYVKGRYNSERAIMTNLVSGQIYEDSKNFTISLKGADDIIVSSNDSVSYIYNTSISLGDKRATVLLFGSTSKTEYTNTYNRFYNATTGEANSSYLEGNLVRSNYGLTRSDSATTTMSPFFIEQKENYNYKYYWYVVAYQWANKIGNSDRFLTMGISDIYNVDTDKPTLKYGSMIGIGGESITSNTTKYTTGTTTIELLDNKKSCLYYKSPGSSSYVLAPANNYSITSFSLNLSSGSSTNNGTWLFYGTDAVGHTTATLTVIADSVAPTGSLSGVSNNGITNGNVSFSFSSDYGRYKIGSGSYVSMSTGTTNFSAEGNYTINLYDTAGNNTYYYFEIDKTAPTGTLNGIVGIDNYTNQDVTFTWSDTRASAKLNGSNYSSGSVISNEGSYTIVLTDTANNSTSYSFIIDKTVPKGTLSGIVGIDNYTNHDVSFTWSDSLATATLNGEEYIKETIISSEDTYTLILTDKATNSTTYTFVIDKTSPTGTLNGIVGIDNYTNQDVSFNWSDSLATAKLNGEEYTKETFISTENSYTLILTDKATNSTTYNFVIDKTAPTGTLSGIVGIDNYTNRDVSFTWKDSLASATLNGEEYIKETIISLEGTYTLFLTDKATNSTTYTFVIDKTAPTGTLNGIVGIDNYTNQDVSFTWSDSLATAKLNGEEYTKETFISTENSYTLILTDKATNSTTYNFVIDKTAPTGTLSGITNITYMITNKDVTFTWSDTKASAKLNSEAYEKGTKIKNEGNYTFVLTDFATNQTVYEFTIDLTAPTIKYNGQVISGIQNYTNQSFILDLENSLDLLFTSYMSTSEYEEQELNHEYNEQGIYRIYAEDLAGNRSDTYIVYYQLIEDFGNKDQIYNMYKKSKWFNVSLPAYVFKATGKRPSIAGTYYFENYYSALDWAKAKEYEYRVTETSEGYIYISATNESVSQVYTTYDSLDLVLTKYAKGYISSQNIYQNAEVKWNGTIMNAAGEADKTALTANSISLPSILEDNYSNIDVFLAEETYRFTQIDTYVTPTITLTYLSNGQTVANSGFSGNIDYNIKIGDFLTSNEADLQGYYLVEESDLCGNSQRYIIYIDKETPTIVAEAAFGDDTKKTISFTSDEIELNNGTYYFISLSIQSIFDNIDSFLCLHIRGTNYNEWLTKENAFITLSSETTGSGSYTITCYDRSYNALIFTIYIAGSIPKWTYSSLSGDNLVLRFSTLDEYNAFTSLSIYQIDYEGNYQEIIEDGEGTPINFATLRYTFYDGGKYTARVTDLYKRTVEFTPIFYLNGLPSGKFNGVADGEATNKDVFFYFQKGYSVIVYTLDNDRNRTVFSNYTIDYAIQTLTYTLSIEATNATNGTYLVFLYTEGNMASFIEYTFTIDTILAEYSLLSASNEDLKTTYSTNEGFYLTWREEGVNVKYTTDGTTYIKYKQGDILSLDGIYNITISDYVGNIEEIVVCVDTSVNYQINGTYANFGGILYSKSDIQFVVNESFTTFFIMSDNGVTVYDGYISEEGSYIVFIEDNYKNTERITIIIDKTAPSGSLSGVANNGTTNKDVTFTWDSDDVYKVIHYGKFNQIIGTVNNGDVFTKDGYYKIVVSDKAANQTVYEFTIDKLLNYTTDIVNKQVTSNSVTFVFAEELKTISVTKDGIEIKNTDTFYKEIGQYLLIAEDYFGNSINYEFTIVNNISRAMELSLYQGQTIATATLNGEEYIPNYSDGKYEFLETGAYIVSIYDQNQKITYSMNFSVDTVAPTIEINEGKYEVFFGDVNKKNVQVELFKDGEQVSFDVNKKITDPGSYVLVISDEYGNSTTYEFNIKYRLSTISILIIAIGSIALLTAIILIIRGRKVKAA